MGRVGCKEPRSRLESGKALAAGSVPLTTLRAAVVVGRGSAGFETIVALVDRLPAMVAPRWISTPTQPIALGDVVRYLVGVAGEPAAVGESFDVGGPEKLTYRDMIERVARMDGHQRYDFRHIERGAAAKADHRVGAVRAIGFDPCTDLGSDRISVDSRVDADFERRKC